MALDHLLELSASLRLVLMRGQHAPFQSHQQQPPCHQRHRDHPPHHHRGVLHFAGTRTAALQRQHSLRDRRMWESADSEATRSDPQCLLRLPPPLSTRSGHMDHRATTTPPFTYLANSITTTLTHPNSTHKSRSEPNTNTQPQQQQKNGGDLHLVMGCSLYRLRSPSCAHRWCGQKA